MKFNVAKPDSEQVKEAPRDPDTRLMDTATSAVKQTEISGVADTQNINGSSVKKQTDSSNVDSNRKKYPHF